MTDGDAGAAAPTGEHRVEHSPTERQQISQPDQTPVPQLFRRPIPRAQRGDVNFAEVHRFEQALASGEPRPDLVVFADGPDEVEVQLQQASDQPSQYGLVTAQQVVHEDHRSLWDQYRDRSFISQTADRLRGLFAFESAAAETPPSPSEIPTLVSLIHARGVALAEEIAVEHAVPVHYAWLPTKASTDPQSTYSAATRGLPEHVIDLSAALDDPTEAVWLDDLHTNEAGAGLVAAALYEALRPELERLASGDVADPGVPG